MAPGNLGTRVYSGQEDLTEALAAPCSIEGRHILPEAVNGPTIVSLCPVGYTEVVVRQLLKDDILASHDECKGALGGGDGLIIGAPEVEMHRQRGRYLSQPTRVVDGVGESLSLAQICQNTPEVAQRMKRRAQGKPEIDGLL